MNEETVYAESEDLNFGEFCANQSSLHGETLSGDANLFGQPAFSISRERFNNNGFRFDDEDRSLFHGERSSLHARPFNFRWFRRTDLSSFFVK
jgi:hypothetical protein